MTAAGVLQWAEAFDRAAAEGNQAGRVTAETIHLFWTICTRAARTARTIAGALRLLATTQETLSDEEFRTLEAWANLLKYKAERRTHSQAGAAAKAGISERSARRLDPLCRYPRRWQLRC